MTIYDDLKPVVSEVFNEFKQTGKLGAIQLVQRVAAAGPVDNPGTSSEVLHTLNATVSGVSWKLISSGLALATDRTLVCVPVEGITPGPKDFIFIDNKRYKIVEDISAPAVGAPLVWKFIIRSGG